MKTLHLLACALALCSISIAAHADDASCKPLVDAAVKMARTPYHEVANVDGKAFEKIYTTRSLSIRRNNEAWTTVPVTPQEVLEAQHESAAYVNCKLLRTDVVDGQRATVYSAQRIATGFSSHHDDAVIWIGANGMVLKTITDTQMRGHKAHSESHVTYNDVHAPAGAQ